MSEREELARLIDPFAQGAPGNEAGEAADRILAAGYHRGPKLPEDADAEIARLTAELAAERARVAVLMEALGQIRHDAGDCGDEETVGFIDSAFVAVLLASPAQPEREEDGAP